MIENINDSRQNRSKPLQEELARISKSVIESVQKRDKYFQLFEDDIIDKSILNSKFSEIAKEIEAQEDKKSKLEAALESDDSSPLPFDFVNDILFNYRAILMNKAPEQQKMLLKLVIKEITISNDKNIKSLNLKFDEQIIKYIIEHGGSPIDWGDLPLFMSNIDQYSNVKFSIDI